MGDQKNRIEIAQMKPTSTPTLDTATRLGRFKLLRIHGEMGCFHGELTGPLEHHDEAAYGCVQREGFASKR